MAFEHLPAFNAAPLAMVFQSAADFARTDGKLPPGTRRAKFDGGRATTKNALKQISADEFLDSLPRENESIHLVLDGAFDLHQIIPRIVELAGETVDSLDLATLSFGDAATDTLLALSDAGKVLKIRLLASHYFRSVDTKTWSRAHSEMTQRGHRMYIARNHSKLQLFRFASGRVLTLIGSANLRGCRAAESLIMFGSAEVYQFWLSMFNEIVAEAARYEASSKGGKWCADQNQHQPPC